MKKKFHYYLYHIFWAKFPVSYSKFGVLSKKLRYYSASKFISKCGQNVNFEKGARFGTDLVIGKNSGVGINSKLSSGVVIGENVMMGPDVVILTKNHNFDNIEKPMINQGLSPIKKVVIENDVWIGQRVIILPGVIIKRGIVIGAGSVVTKTFPEYSIIAGNPAKIIKSRNNK